MRKILMLLLVVICLFIVPKVEAQEYKLVKIDQDGVYFTRTGGTIPDKVGKFAIYYLGDNLAYCIDPSKSIRTEDYVTADGYVDLPYSDEIKEKLELYGYYGREYPGHDNVRYSMAAQALIWEAAGSQTVTFTTKWNGEGDIIDVSKEKNEILSLVEKHRRLPDLPSHIYVDVLHEHVYEDKNKALDNYEVIGGGPYEAHIENNKLYIMPRERGIYSINLRRWKYDDLNTLIFVGKNNSDTQTLGRLRFSDLDEREITLVIDGAHLFVQKVDDNNEPIMMNGIKFKVKNLQTGEYLCDFPSCEYETDQAGIFVTNDLDFGEYEIEEVENQIVKGYAWNSEKKRVSIYPEYVNWENDKASFVDVIFKNHAVRASLELTKKGEERTFNNNEIIYNEINLSNIYFDLYDDNDKFIETLVTDNNGFVKSGNLKVGKYYLLEKTTLDGYVPNTDKIRFEIKQTSSHQIEINYRLTVRNYLKKGKLEFSKVDVDTREGISNTIIEIYNENNELLLTRETDDNGKIIIDNLPLGKYYIKEKEANYFYQKSNETIPFEISDNSEVIKKEMTNKKITGIVDVVKYAESLVINDNDINYEMKKVKDIEFNLFDENDNLIDVLKTDANGSFKKELALGKYYLQEKTKDAKYKENNEKYYFEIKKDGNNGSDVSISVNNYLKKGGVIFSKEEIFTKIGIADTIMEIYDESNKLLLTKTTNNIGQITINNLPLGKYYLKEKEANYFYKIVDIEVPFEIKKDGEIVYTNLTNEKIVGNLEIIKNGENYHFIDNSIVYEKVKLHNIEFDLYNEDNVLIGSIITNQDGYAKYNNLPIGKYYLIEKTNLNNYVRDNKYPFEIKKEGNKGIDVKLEINNYLKKGKLEFSKNDYDTKEGIANTIIEVLNDKDQVLLTRETNENGQIIIENLPLGKYFIREKEANYYYQKTDEIKDFEIKNHEDNIKVTMLNKKLLGNVEIFKKGEDYKFINNEILYEKTELANIIFDLYDENDKLIKASKTNDDGYIKFSDLSLGKYYVIERNGLNNYILNNDKYMFEIKKDGNSVVPVKLEINNYLKKGKLEFKKEDLETQEGIPNTVVELYNSNNQLLMTRETDENGIINISDLPAGKYYIIEKEANSLYQLTNEKVFFEIKENDEIVVAKMTNEKLTVPVPKTNTNEGVIAHSLFGICFLIGLGRMYYERKETF